MYAQMICYTFSIRNAVNVLFILYFIVNYRFKSKAGNIIKVDVGEYVYHVAITFNTIQHLIIFLGYKLMTVDRKHF